MEAVELEAEEEADEDRGEVLELEVESVEKMEAAATATRLPLPDSVPNRLSVFLVVLVGPPSIDGPPLELVVALIERDPPPKAPNRSSFPAANHLLIWARWRGVGLLNPSQIGP
jgi:hypothetical protein